MNAELYTEYCKHMDRSIGKIASQFQIPIYALEESILDAFQGFASCFDPNKGSVQSYCNRCFWNAAIDLYNRSIPIQDTEEEQPKYINQERQVFLADMISNLSDASRFIVNSVLSGTVPIKKVKRHGGKEKVTIKKWLLTKGWKQRQIKDCFEEIQTALGGI